ncbi:HSP20-like chaperone [Parasponia andersonii]|uniref:HSP20-like chaperone n=1 Tax=Parasponia andersonii TaxID=3476 RepID=A0A2P5BJN4_PARAD|nr:HSP20-like chaperone [Parasponia andersonii]
MHRLIHCWAPLSCPLPICGPKVGTDAREESNHRREKANAIVRTNNPWVGSDLWDPFGFGSSYLGQRDDTTAPANAEVDWRETDYAHIFGGDIPGT